MGGGREAERERGGREGQKKEEDGKRRAEGEEGARGGGGKGRRENGRREKERKENGRRGKGNERKGRKETIIQQAALRVYKVPQHRGNNVLIQSYYK